MFRLNQSTGLATKRCRRRALLLALLLLLGAAATGPWLWAWYQLRQGRFELEHAHPEKARRHLSACLRFWPHHVTAHLLASRAARQLEDYDEAEEHLLQAQREQRQPSNEVVLEWALHRATLGDLKLTEAYLLPLTREDSEEAFLACEALAQGYQRLYRISKAQFLLDLWLRRRPNDVRPLLLRGRLWSQTDGLQQALPDYRRVLELEPECEEAQRGLASCLTESTRWNEAVPYWEELLRRHPADLEARANLALCWGNLGQEQRALQMLRAVLAERPDYLLALRSLGQILLQEQQPAEAEIYLRRALRAAPQDYRSHWLLHHALQQQDKTAEAEHQLDQIKQLELRMRHLNSNITHLESAAQSHDASLQAELGVLLLELGYEEAGRNWLLSALQEDPNCAPARAALEKANQNRGASVGARDEPAR
jgi:lipopolysaccharide biosynthesis regulator YciM